MSQGQRSRSNVTNFQSLVAFIMGHIPTKLHWFLTSSIRDFLRQTYSLTERRRRKQYLLAACAQVRNQILTTQKFAQAITCKLRIQPPLIVKFSYSSIYQKSRPSTLLISCTNSSTGLNVDAPPSPKPLFLNFIKNIVWVELSSVQ